MPDDRTGYLAPRAGLVDRDDRLVGVRDSALARAPERHPHGLGEPFSPEIRRDLSDRARDLVVVARVDRERDEAEASVADPDVVDVELERSGERTRFGVSHFSSRMVGGVIDTSKQATRDASAADPCRICDREGTKRKGLVGPFLSDPARVRPLAP
jgi:hypothetical protein